LSYKDDVLENTYYTGEYKDSYKDILDESVSCKVSLYTVADLKYNYDLDTYFLNTKSNDKLYFFGTKMGLSGPNTLRKVRPVITISKDILTTGSGTNDDPYRKG
jgi:hypothetical protein